MTTGHPHRVLIDYAPRVLPLIDEPTRPAPQRVRRRTPQRRVRGRFASEQSEPAAPSTPSQPPRTPPGGGLASDRLEGGRAIAAFLFGADDRRAVKRVYHLAKMKRIPHGEEGGKLIASVAQLRAHWRELSTNKTPELAR